MKRPIQHETDAAGQRLLREAFEGFGWVVNAIENDYGADYEIEIFKQGGSTGAAFKVQLKSSRGTQYSADGATISQPIRVANAKYLTHELRLPTVVIHCDVDRGRAYWIMPQLDAAFSERLRALDDDQSITLRIPVANDLPASEAAFIEALQRADAAVSIRAARRVGPNLVADVSEAVGGDTDEIIRAYQAHSDAIRLDQAYKRALIGDLNKAFDLVRQLLDAPGSAAEDKFRAWLIWEMAELNRQIVAGNSDRSRVEISQKVASELKALVKRGPSHLRYYAAVFSLAADVSALAHDGNVLGMAEMFAAHDLSAFQLSRQQLDRRLDLVLIRSARIINRLLRTRHAWVLPTALSRLATSIRIARLRFEQEGRGDAAQNLGVYGLDLCRAAARIAKITGDDTSLASVASSALLFSGRDSDEAMTLATGLAHKIKALDERAFVDRAMSQHRRLNAGERIEVKIKTTQRQIIENIEDGLRFGRPSVGR